MSLGFAPALSSTHPIASTAFLWAEGESQKTRFALAVPQTSANGLRCEARADCSLCSNRTAAASPGTVPSRSVPKGRTKPEADRSLVASSKC